MYRTRSVNSLLFGFVFLFSWRMGMAWQVCDSCRPLELLEAPRIAPALSLFMNVSSTLTLPIGIAFDLTLGYGVSATYFQNGTSRGLAKVEGSLEYQSLMPEFAERGLAITIGTATLEVFSLSRSCLRPC
jgi:hypothetical protein